MADANCTHDFISPFTADEWYCGGCESARAPHADRRSRMSRGVGMDEAQEVIPHLIQCPDVGKHCPQCLQNEYEAKTGLAIISCQGAELAHCDHTH